MNTTSNILRHKQGHILIISLIFTGLVVLSATLLFRINSQKVFTEHKRANHIRALMIAEAGAHEAFAMLTDNFSLRNDPFPITPINGGSYSINITDIDSESSADEILLSSTGSYNEETAEVAIIIRHTSTGTDPTDPGVDPDVLELFKAACFCGGNASLTGNVNADLGGSRFHANGTITVKGSSKIRNGQTTTSQGAPRITGTSTISPTALFNQPEEMIEINMEPFYLHAKSLDTPNYTYTKWSYTFTDSYVSASELPRSGWQKGRLMLEGWNNVVRPNGGVLWVEGDVKITGNTKVYGCIIATGDISVGGSSQHFPTNPGMPSYMSVNGEVNITSACIVNGLVYSHNGDIVLNGYSGVRGAFICPRGDFVCANSGGITYMEAPPSGPNGENVMLPEADAGTPDGPPELVGWVK